VPSANSRVRLSRLNKGLNWISFTNLALRGMGESVAGVAPVEHGFQKVFEELPGREVLAARNGRAQQPGRRRHSGRHRQRLDRLPKSHHAAFPEPASSARSTLMTSLRPEKFPHRPPPSQGDKTSGLRLNGRGGPQATLTHRLPRLAFLGFERCRTARAATTRSLSQKDRQEILTETARCHRSVWTAALPAASSS
jgi:hypothetical protein